MSVDKKVSYEIQGGVKNYRPSKMVTVPKIAKSSPDTPTATWGFFSKHCNLFKYDKNLVTFKYINSQLHIPTYL